MSICDSKKKESLYIRIYKFTNSSQKISTHLLIMEVDFCPVLCIPKCLFYRLSGISHFVSVQEDDGYYFSADSFIEEMRAIQFTGSCQRVPIIMWLPVQ